VYTHGHDEIRICVLQNGNLQEVRVRYNTQTGDTTVAGRPFSEVFPPDPPGYAAGARWMILNEPIPFRGRRYVKYGRARVLGAREVERTGEYQGTPLFREAGESGDPIVLYVPVLPGCVFQPYQNTANVGAVRG
jgi:hypothetical protein